MLRFGVKRGLRSVEIDPEDFRKQLANKHGLWVPNFGRMQDVPLEQLDEIAGRLDAPLITGRTPFDAVRRITLPFVAKWRPTGVGCWRPAMADR